MHITKQQITKGIIALYVILSLIYIVYTAWVNFTVRYAQRSFEQGREATVAQLIQQAEDENCQPFSVYTEEKQIQLVNTACLEQKEAKKEEGTAAAEQQ